MQTRVDAEIVVLFKAEVDSQDIRNTRYRTAGKRIVKYKRLSKPGIRISELQARNRQNQNRETKGCFVQYHKNRHRIKINILTL